MRKTTKTLTTPVLRTFTIEYPNSVAFMYSPQIIKVQLAALSVGGSVEVLVTHTPSGRNYAERRRLYATYVTFDISRIMQLLAPDVDTLFQRLDYEKGKSLTEAFSLGISYLSEGSSAPVSILDTTMTGMYGTLDQGEIYGEHTQRRLWYNFPQTFNLWTEKNGEVAFVLSDAFIHPEVAGDGPCAECDLVGTMLASEDTSDLSKFFPGHYMHDIGLTWLNRVEGGVEIPDEYRLLTVIPDPARPGDGTYLRWLNRRGEVSYWLFKNSQIRVNTSIDKSFTKYYEGDITLLQSNTYLNTQKADYREARELVLGAVGLSRDEYDDLCDLATSPLVERLLPNVPEDDTEVDVVYDGGSASVQTSVVVESGEDQGSVAEGGNAITGRLAKPPYIWQRVNVAAGSFARGILRGTPSRQDLEFIVELPERNTIKL